MLYTYLCYYQINLNYKVDVFILHSVICKSYYDVTDALHSLFTRNNQRIYKKYIKLDFISIDTKQKITVLKLVLLFQGLIKWQ